METAQELKARAVVDVESGHIQKTDTIEGCEKIPGETISPSPETGLPISSHPTSTHQNPKDWPRAKKWTSTLILSAFAFLQPLSETMLAPVEVQISRSLHITQAYEWLLVNSLILIGVGLSPLILAPLSEVYGRKPIIIIGSSIFAIWNMGCGAARTLDQMLAFRLLSGFGASVADATSGGVLSDLWRVEERGKVFAVYMAAPLLGPALGPIIGSYISQGIYWRWIFWIISIACAIVILIAIAFFRETYEPRIAELHNRAAKKIDRSGSSTPLFENETPFLELMRPNLQRPFRMLGTQVIIQLLAGYMALLYGILFLFLFMYPRMWTVQYNESITTGSINYLSFAVGLLLGVTIAGPLNDHVYSRLKARNNGVGRPEFRIPPMAIGTILVPVGLLLWGWAGEAKVHWIVPNIGSLIFGAGMYVCSGCVSVYTIDTYAQHAASAISTNLVMRSLTGAIFPLFAPYMFNSLGFGLGATILAGAFAVFGSVVVFTLWFFGERLRARSPYCAAALDKD
ncbi:hypothetical protein DSL72_005229 [Monilinia vaccinii-corymbosi]|uniref:Major facilitator superfamily (MFS) profile domain-containing protein n=1 Tax=Monilinia vaccinii-corymbosi TaxID=61207 RepID=A0A8A3PF40_9HELO|nr:hypothetical protein DSL72_005229 [Monilinia vaccinii-corymbosi]